MNASQSEFIATIKKAKTCELITQHVDQLLATKSADELGAILVDLASSEAIGNGTLGYYVFPGLLRLLKKDNAVLDVIAQLVKQSELPETFIMHCIMLMANHYRKTQGALPPPEFVSFIRDVTADPQVHPSVRARVARLLTRLPEKDRQDILEILITSGDAQLIEAACHTIARWSKAAYAEHQDMIERLIAYVRQSPREALKHPQLMRTVARIDHPRVDAAIEKIIAQTKSKEDVVRLAACLAPGRSEKQLVDVVGIAKKSGPEGRLAMRHLIRREPALLDLLYQGDHYQDLVDVIETEPTYFGQSAIRYLERIKTVEGGPSEAAKKLEYEISLTRSNAFLSGGVLRERRSRSGEERSAQPGETLRYGTSKQPLFSPYNTGFNMGDALYRDTHLIDPFCHNHWHAGIFQAFELFPTGTDATGIMRGVHMTGFPGDVKQFAARSDAFGSPGCDLAAAMRNLHQKFLEKFMVDDDHPFHGARQTQAMSKVDRLNLLQTSEDLTHRSIYYTFADMLDWHGTHWSGSIDDIDNLRCDGVVEYTYEACGKKVCTGTQAAHWNIAAPGNQHPESHADLHTWDVNDGELCPKIQAGAEGHDTELVPTRPSAPDITEFAIHEETRTTGRVVVIKFNIASADYYNVYVRILVGPEGGPFGFAVTQPIGDAGIAGKWLFKEVDEGTHHLAYWLKDNQVLNTGGNAANLEFRLVAVDKGGNVSAEYFSRLPLN